MTALRQRPIDDLTLRGYAQRTIGAYVGAVARLSQFFHAAPDQLTEEQLRTYLVQLTTTRASATVTQALSALRFFYEQTLGRHWTILDLTRPPREKKLPAVLSRDEVRRVLEAIHVPAYRVCIATIHTSCCTRSRDTTRVGRHDRHHTRTDPPPSRCHPGASGSAVLRPYRAEGPRSTR